MKNPKVVIVENGSAASGLQVELERRLHTAENALQEREEQLKLVEIELEKFRTQFEELLRERTSELNHAMLAVTSATPAFLEPDVLLSKILEVLMTIPGIQADAGWALVLEEELEKSAQNLNGLACHLTENISQYEL